MAPPPGAVDREVGPTAALRRDELVDLGIDRPIFTAMSFAARNRNPTKDQKFKENAVRTVKSVYRSR